MPDRDGAVAPSFLPYGRQEIGATDVKAVVEALVSGWLTTGPRVSEFEQAFAARVDACEGVAVNSGTAALHCAMRALEVTAGDEVIVPAITSQHPPMRLSMKVPSRYSRMLSRIRF